MIDIALDPTTSDLLITDFGASLVNEGDQIAQNLSIRLKFIQGQWFLNVLSGIPYYEYFFIKAPNQIQVESFIKEAIVNTIGVTSITDFSSQYEPKLRTFNVNFSCQTTFGEIEMNQELP